MSVEKKTITTVRSDIELELLRAGDRPAVAAGTSTLKKNYAEALSRALSLRFADGLRGGFPGILPNPDGTGQESKARTGKGLKKLDVNYSTVELGLGLGVSIKTINFRDGASGRYTKNYTRVDNELRAEASDYHERQPYAVLCGVVFLPLDSCLDGSSSKQVPSSFGQAVRIFRGRTGRDRPTDDPTLFEKIWIGLYDTNPERFGRVGFFDVDHAPPRTGVPSLLEYAGCIAGITAAYDRRNKSSFTWADGATEVMESAPTKDA